MSNIIVIGAGWSGLTCAYRIAKAGHRVTVLEAAPQIGGRARSVAFKDHIVDNGQHLCLGAYQHTLGLIAELGLDPSHLFHRLPLQINTIGKHRFKLKIPDLPMPYNLLAGLLAGRNVRASDKARIAKFFWKMRRRQFLLEQDCTVLELLDRHGQSAWLIQNLWEPLALAAMTTPIAIGSAQVFLNILRLTFNGNAQHSNWLLPRCDLSRVLPEHLAQRITALGGEIICNAAVKNLKLQDNRCIAIATHKQTMTASNLVLAIPPWQAQSLLPSPEFAKFSYQPIITMYVACKVPIKLPYPMLGLNGSLSQWIFDRAFAGQPNIASIVISGAGEHLALDNRELLMRVTAELTDLFPVFNTVNDYMVVREKRAAFTCDVKIQTQRPTSRTWVSNLWLAGDYLQTGLPATLEGAIISGNQTAGELLLDISPRSNHYC